MVKLWGHEDDFELFWIVNNGLNTRVVFYANSGYCVFSMKDIMHYLLTAEVIPERKASSEKSEGHSVTIRFSVNVVL